MTWYASRKYNFTFLHYHIEVGTLCEIAIRRLRIAICLCVDSLLTQWPGRSKPLDAVLIIRLDAIGDFVLWLDAAQAIVSFYKSQGKRTVLLANVAWSSWARELGMFDDVIDLDRHQFENKLVYRWRLGRRVRMKRCLVAVNPTYSREFLLGDALIRISNAEQRIGFDGDKSLITSQQKQISDRWYTHLIAADPTQQMELIRNAEFVRGLGDSGFRAKVADLHSFATLRLNEDFVIATESAPYYVLFPSASWDMKKWPVANFAEIAHHISRETGWKGVVCGAPSDIKLANDLCSQCDGLLLNWAGRTDLTQLAAVLSSSQLLVTNDTSATHVAAACGIPTVCILGGGHYGRFLPYQIEHQDRRPLPRVVAYPMPCFGCNWQCRYQVADGQPAPCIDHITVQQAWSEISSLLPLPTARQDYDKSVCD